MNEACALEVVELHQFFQAWFTANLPDQDDSFARVALALARGFEIVSPSGAHIARTSLLRGLRAAHGQYKASEFAIEVRDIRVSTVVDGVYRVTYEEWQQGGQEDGGRLSTAIMRTNDEAPNEIEWVHLHETWMPGRGAN